MTNENEIKRYENIQGFKNIIKSGLKHSESIFKKSCEIYSRFPSEYTRGLRVNADFSLNNVKDVREYVGILILDSGRILREINSLRENPTECSFIDIDESVFKKVEELIRLIKR